MSHGEPGIHLHRQEHAIGNVIALNGVGQSVHVHRPGGRGTGLGPECGIAIPAQRYENVVTKAAGDRHRCVLERCRRAGSAHVNGSRIAQHVDTQIGGHFFRCRVDRRRNHAVDVGWLQPGIRNRLARSFEHHVDRGIFGPLDEYGFTDARDRGPVTEIEGGCGAHF